MKPVKFVDPVVMEALLMALSEWPEIAPLGNADFAWGIAESRWDLLLSPKSKKPMVLFGPVAMFVSNQFC